MTGKIREIATIGVVLAIVLGAEVFGLRGGKLGYIIIAAVVLLALLLVTFRLDTQRMGVGAVCLAAFTATWNGVFVAGLRPSDVLIPIALALFLLARPDGAFSTPPWWVKQLVLVLVVGVIIQIFFPPDYAYLVQRTVVNAGGKPRPPVGVDLVVANLAVAAKFIIAVAFIPMAFVGAVRVERRSVRWIAVSFATGTALSGWVGMADHLGANLAHLLTGLSQTSARTAGFSNQPNYLAAGAVIALPFGYWLLFSGDRKLLLLGLFSIPGMVLGVYSSGSRGGAVCVVLAIALCIALHPRTRIYSGQWALGILAAAGAIVVALPSLGAEILKVTRLNNPDAAGSDAVRAIVGAQGVRDFHHSPLFGIGLQVSASASQVYLQELASGGLLLFIGVSIYFLGGIYSAARLMPSSSLAGMVVAALLATVALNFFEADLTDRFYYVPAAVLIALYEHRRLSQTGPPGPSGDGDALAHRAELTTAGHL